MTATPPPLPPRPAHSLPIHWLVDSAVAGLVIVLPCIFFGVSLPTIAIAALILGIPLAPFSRRYEQRELAARSAGAQPAERPLDAGAQPAERLIDGAAEHDEGDAP